MIAMHTCNEHVHNLCMLVHIAHAAQNLHLDLTSDAVLLCGHVQKAAAKVYNDTQ
jgi:hypothetical protein